MKVLKWTLFSAAIVNLVGFCIYSTTYQKELVQLKTSFAAINDSLAKSINLLTDLTTVSTISNDSFPEKIKTLTNKIAILRDSLNNCCPEYIPPNRSTEILKSLFYSKINSDTISYRLKMMPDKKYNYDYFFRFYLINDISDDITVAKSATYDPAKCQVFIYFPFAETISSKDSAAFEISPWDSFDSDQFIITAITESTGKKKIFTLRLIPQYD